MPQGRCAGCGETSASCKKINAHVLECPEYKALYKADPSKALSPREEYARWLREDGKLLEKADRVVARAQRAEDHRRINDRKLATEAERWSSATSHRSTSRPVTTPDDGQAWGVKRDEVVPESLVDLGKRVASWRFNRMMQ
jgi:hypothetical protein